jgi:prepilin-type N-terminal cleavage/methylation domain-containing protein
MDCRITSIKRPTKARRSAFTLAEILVAVAIGALVLMVVAMAFIYTTRWAVSMANYVGLDKQSQMALDRLSKEVRQVQYLTKYSTTNVSFQDYDGKTLQFVYDAAQKKLTRKKAGEADQVYLTGCDYLQFLIYQRNVIEGTLDAYTTASVTNCKLVHVEWLCSSNIFGTKANTETMRSAKIVIRKT